MAIHNLILRAKGPNPVRIDIFLAQEITSFLSLEDPDIIVSKSKIRRLIFAGAVTRHGQTERRPEKTIQPGTVIQVKLDTTRFVHEKQPDDISFELDAGSILYEDKWLLIVNKPARFPTEATVVNGRDHLHAACKRYLDRNSSQRNPAYCGLLHRLDRETSGVILFSKTRTVNAAIQEQFINKTIQKKYYALTMPQDRSCIKGTHFSVKNHLARITPKSAQGLWGAVPTGGDEAHTDFEIAGEYNGIQMIHAWPRTGRTHQIRVHLAGVGMPILGDTLYGGITEFRGTPIPRVMLHAAELRLVHPDSGVVLSIVAPIPGDYVTATKIVEKKQQ